MKIAKKCIECVNPEYNITLEKCKAEECKRREKRFKGKGEIPEMWKTHK